MRRLASIALLAGGLALGACGGGDDKKSAESYAGDFCEAAQDWVGSLRSGARGLDVLGPNATPQQGRDALLRFFDEGIDDTEEFSEELQAAGTPDVEGGDDAAEALKSAVQQAKGVLEQARSQTERLPTDSEARFSVEARKVGNSARDSLGRVGDAIARPRSSELRRALREAPGCRRLRSS